MKLDDLTQKEYLIKVYPVGRNIVIHCNSNDALVMATDLKNKLHEKDGFFDREFPDKPYDVSIRVSKFMDFRHVVRVVERYMRGDTEETQPPTQKE